MRGMPIRSFVLAVAVSALCIGGALGQKQPTRESMDDDVKQSYDGECAPGCKPAFVGDQNCDEECNHEWCDFDGGDCESEWKLRRMIVMGAFYTSVDSVEYQLEGPRGEIKKLTMEEGRRMEGIDEASSEIETDWRAMLLSEEEDELTGETWKTVIPQEIQGDKQVPDGATPVK